METGGGDKKSFQRLKITTRIPLPVEPLPSLPKHLLSKINVEKQKNVRAPLETISQPPNANIASSSSNIVQKTLVKPRGQKKRVLKINTNHITVRSKTESLDWDFKIFKDDSSNSITDDNSDEKEINEVELVEDKQKKCFVTPAVPIEHKGVRNVKKSLKRPHSRELQGISTPGKRERKEEEKVKRQLRFNENLLEKLQSPDHWKKSYMTCLTRDYTTDMFEHLLAVERKPLDVPARSSTTRACVINWLMRVHSANGNPAIIQIACWYFDSILSIDYVSLDKLQLVAVACYWIAQKLDSPTTPAKTLVRISKNAFTTSQLLQTEKAILMRLKFPIRPVVPQEFITYLSWWCDQDHPGEIEVAATFLCMSGMMVDKTLCQEFPSVIAAASVRNAVLLLGKREMIDRIQLCPVYKAAVKKSSSIYFLSMTLHRALRIISDPEYEYKAPLEHYGVPPYNIAQKIINAAAEMAVTNICHKWWDKTSPK